MGLDMYLEKRTYVKQWDHHSDEERHEVTVKKGGKIREDIDPKKVSYIIEQAAYWRKANAIHAWFVENVQEGNDDCRSYYVSEENMKELLDACEEVLNSTKLVDGTVVQSWSIESDGNGGIIRTPNMEMGQVMEDNLVAQNVLPTTSGFFFGSEDYDEWYYKDIEYTRNVLKKILESKSDASYYYESSW